uniref:Uncharacterized protein n=1 Tax=Solanum tuberosum TaxID=4113 RepID=M1D7E6_SOLTU
MEFGGGTHFCSEITLYGNFDYSIESGVSNLIGLHIFFACTGFERIQITPSKICELAKPTDVQSWCKPKWPS